MKQPIEDIINIVIITVVIAIIAVVARGFRIDLSICVAIFAAEGTNFLTIIIIVHQIIIIVFSFTRVVGTVNIVIAKAINEIYKQSTKVISKKQS